MQQISRRKFIALTATGLASTPQIMVARSSANAITAGQIVDRIQKEIGPNWNADTVDTFKAGEPSTVVTGIVTTALPSLRVMEEALKSGANFIITCEPTFFSKDDKPTPPVRRMGPLQRGAPSIESNSPPSPDPVFSAKDSFIKKHKLVVWRFSDHWRLHRPDPFSQGLAATLGWSKFIDANDPKQITIPETSLDALVSHTKKSLHTRGGMRIVGNPQQRIRKIALLPGTTSIQASIEVLPGVDAIIAGEVREWESVEYVRDTVALGGKKSLTLVGRIVSEDPGMQVCAQWLKAIVPEVKTRWISAGDPYWRPIA
jgi:putative NIF3 family GTP cyclohydrolase 1 type 2